MKLLTNIYMSGNSPKDCTNNIKWVYLSVLNLWIRVGGVDSFVVFFYYMLATFL